MYKPKHQPKPPAGTEAPNDDIELLPGERACLAVLALRLCDDEWPQFIREQQGRLNKQIKADGAAARSTHWQLNAGKALMAARRYIELQNLNTPISLDDVAKQFGTSPRAQ